MRNSSPVLLECRVDQDDLGFYTLNLSSGIEINRTQKPTDKIYTYYSLVSLLACKFHSVSETNASSQEEWEHAAYQRPTGKMRSSGRETRNARRQMSSEKGNVSMTCLDKIEQEFTVNTDRLHVNKERQNKPLS